MVVRPRAVAQPVRVHDVRVLLRRRRDARLRVRRRRRAARARVSVRAQSFRSDYRQRPCSPTPGTPPPRRRVQLYVTSAARTPPAGLAEQAPRTVGTAAERVGRLFPGLADQGSSRAKSLVKPRTMTQQLILGAAGAAFSGSAGPAGVRPADGSVSLAMHALAARSSAAPFLQSMQHRGATSRIITTAVLGRAIRATRRSLPAFWLVGRSLRAERDRRPPRRCHEPDTTTSPRRRDTQGGRFCEVLARAAAGAMFAPHVCTTTTSKLSRSRSRFHISIDPQRVLALAVASARSYRCSAGSSHMRQTATSGRRAALAMTAAAVAPSVPGTRSSAYARSYGNRKTWLRSRASARDTIAIYRWRCWSPTRSRYAIFATRWRRTLALRAPASDGLSWTRS